MLDRSAPPAMQAIASVTMSEATVKVLPNGSRIHILANDKQPVIKLEIVFKAGKWFETAKGVSYFTAKMLTEGTQNFSAKAIADKVAYFGAALECNQGYDRATITLYCLSKHFAVLLPLVNELATTPLFPEAEFQLLKKRTIQNILVEKQKNSYLANKLFTESIYGLDSPYISGLDEKDIEAVTIQQLSNFFAHYYTARETEIFLAGEVTPTILEDLNNLLKLKSGNNNLVENININKNFYIKEKKVKREEMLQSSIKVGTRFPLRTHPDFPKLSLLNKILGGYFGSRLMRNIREDKGFTYGIHSSLSAKEKDTLFSISTEVKGENTDQTLTEIYKEIRLLKEELVDKEELETVKNYTVGKFLNETTTIFDQVDKYKNIITHNLPSTYYSDYIKAILETSAEEIQLLAKEYLGESELVEVVVGKF